ncbi:UNKNOWN [Stylonychia lemnae]|uniref:Uncharacterized protein n=1 Tax=Stylonychia lemnae TaxID=5949 RepID=A0A078ALA5_STYLE|nr:UNKNOWN [Stylonychia lemnae]|eukprot:CDW83145.1 UNKNOWN [Stylonychia lemnae]
MTRYESRQVMERKDLIEVHKCIAQCIDPLISQLNINLYNQKKYYQRQVNLDESLNKEVVDELAISLKQCLLEL